MFYVIYIFVIAFALYLIFHDRFGEEGQRKSLSSGPSTHTIQPEPENPHDPQAQAVIRSDGKKLGYIARNTLPQYQNFNPTNAVCPFAGRVKVTRQGYLWAEILVALPMDRDFVKEELTSYLEAIPYES